MLKNWHFMRIFRAIFAGLIFSQIWQTGEWLLAIPGGIFALQAIFDVGCCGAASRQYTALSTAQRSWVLEKTIKTRYKKWNST
jgi:hypothetical protein